MAEEILKSRIIGRAQVVFGGGVNVSLGTVGQRKDAFAIGLSELKYPAKKAGEEPPSDDTWGVQVTLVFPDIDTLNIFRDILGELEAEIKEKIKAEEAQQSLDFKDDQQQEETTAAENKNKPNE